MNMSFHEIKAIAEAFRCATVMSEAIADGVYARDDVPTAVADEIAQDAVIIAGRVKAAQEIIEKAYPGFAGIMAQVTLEAQSRAQEMQDKGLI